MPNLWVMRKRKLKRHLEKKGIGRPAVSDENKQNQSQMVNEERIKQPKEKALQYFFRLERMQINVYMYIYIYIEQYNFQYHESTRTILYIYI